MALIDKTNWNIYYSNLDINTNDNCFEVDENIALTLRELNRKGYITNFSCAGHLFGDEMYLTNENGEPSSNTILVYNSTCYISFEEELLFKTLPEGFNQEIDESDNTTLISKRYTSKAETIEKQIEIAQTMLDLYNWAIGLENK